VCDEKNITSGLAENLLVNVQMDGASWQGKTSEKYLDHAHRLETYISNDRSDSMDFLYSTILS
jgi:hypothetical protein